MYLTVGEIAKVLGVSTEMIRFYVREGIIKPRKNEENNYWEYSSLDVLYLSDILFYRNLDLPLKSIKNIFEGVPVEEIGSIITERKLELIESIEKQKLALQKLEEWEDCYREEFELIGKFNIGRMPEELRKEGYYDEEDHLARYLQGNIKINREDWIYVSLSFYYNLNDENSKLKRYLSVNKTRETAELNWQEDIIEESAEKCIYTQVFFSENPEEMLRPLIEFAKKSGYELTGEFYGRENTNYYVEGKRLGMYRVYAPIK